MNMPPASTVIIIALISGMCCAHLARKEGKKVSRWFWIGFLFGVPGFLFLFFSTIYGKKKEAKLVPPPLTFTDPADQEKLWYYLTPEKKHYGPISFNALEEAFLTNKISSTTYIWNDTLDNWKRLGDFLP